MKKCGKTCFMNRNRNAWIVLCLVEENKLRGEGSSAGVQTKEGGFGG